MRDGVHEGRVPTPIATTAASVLHDRLLAMGKDVTVERVAGTRRYHRAGAVGGERPFAVMRPLATRVDVGFHKLGRARSKRILHAAGKLPFVPYRVVVEAAGDVDAELLAWLQESYESSGSGAP